MNKATLNKMLKKQLVQKFSLTVIAQLSRLQLRPAEWRQDYKMYSVSWFYYYLLFEFSCLLYELSSFGFNVPQIPLWSLTDPMQFLPMLEFNKSYVMRVCGEILNQSNGNASGLWHCRTSKKLPDWHKGLGNNFGTNRRTNGQNSPI